MDIGRVPRQGRHVRHAGIHIRGPHGVSHGFVLLHHGFVRLAVLVAAGSVSALVEEELGLIQVFPVARHEIEPCQGHLRNLMAGYPHQLPLARPDLAAHAVGIPDGDVQEVAFARGLVVGDGPLHHVPQVVELMAQFLHLLPPLAPGPLVRVLGVHRAGSIEVTVRLLGRGHDFQHAVDIGFQLLVGIGLQQVARPLDGLVHVRIVERQASHLVALARMGGLDEVLIPSRLLALAERQRYRHLTAGLQPLSPETVGHPHGSERDGRERIAVGQVLSLHIPHRGKEANRCQ